MEYKERSYRSRFSNDERRWFCVKFLESDLWIGVDRGSYSASMESDTYAMLVDLRRTMDAYLLMDPGYKTALTPYDAGLEAPDILKEMSRVSHKTGIGPMSAVAGAVALCVAEYIKSKFGVKDIIVEHNSGQRQARNRAGIAGDRLRQFGLHRGV